MRTCGNALIHHFLITALAHVLFLFLLFLTGASLGLLTGELSVMASAATSAADLGVDLRLFLCTFLLLRTVLETGEVLE